MLWTQPPEEAIGAVCFDSLPVEGDAPRVSPGKPDGRGICIDNSVPGIHRTRVTIIQPWRKRGAESAVEAAACTPAAALDALSLP